MIDKFKKNENTDIAQIEKEGSDYQHSDLAEKQKKFEHFPESVSDINKQQIENYNSKKRQIEISSLKARKEILCDHAESFDSENIKRLYDELDGDKIELYSDDVFQVYISSDKGSYITLGSRDMEDGKIAVRDSDDVATLDHTSIHETMHDMSNQDKKSAIMYESDDGREKIVDEILISGIQENHRGQKYVDGLPLKEKIYFGNKNFGLNEGITEMYTLETMEKLDVPESYESYTQQTAWAMYIKDRFGDALVSDAYFGGDVYTLENKFDEVCGTPGSWKIMNSAIDCYSQTGEDNPELKKLYKEAVDNILLQLDSRNKVKVKTL